MVKVAFSSLCRRCQTHLTKVQQRPISTSIRKLAVAEPTSTSSQRYNTQSKDQPFVPSAEIAQLAKNASNEAQTRPRAGVGPDEPYHLNVFSHKHNTHVSFTEPSRDVILAFSSGNIGLRKAQRGSFDAAYQLATYTFRKIAEKNWRVGGKKAQGTPITLNDPSVRQRGIEVILRGYGPGREAFQKAILGSEGRIIKNLVKRVSDSTRLKFGGVRARAVRRL